MRQITPGKLNYKFDNAKRQVEIDLPLFCKVRFTKKRRFIEGKRLNSTKKDGTRGKCNFELRKKVSKVA